MIEGPVLYRAFAVVFGLATVGFFAWSLGQPSGRRRYGLAVAAACLSMTVANGLMANDVLATTVDGATAPNARFLGYVLAFVAISWLLGAIAGAGWRLTTLVALSICGLPAAVLASWNLSGEAASAASGLTILFIVLTVALLVGPVSSAASHVSGERRLLYGKLRNLSVLIWIVLPVVGVFSEQNMAVLTSFAGIFLGSYLDLILLVGIGVITLRSPTALDQMAGRVAGDGSTGDEAADDDIADDVIVGTLSDD